MLSEVLLLWKAVLYVQNWVGGSFCRKIKKKLESNGWFWQLLTYSFLRFHLGKKKMAPNPLTVASPPGRRLS